MIGIDKDGYLRPPPALRRLLLSSSVGICALLATTTLVASADVLPRPAKKLKTGGELTVEMNFRAPPRTRLSNTCAADVEIDYEQRGEEFHVLARVSGTECPTAYGTYTVRARTTDDDDNVSTQRFEERWQIEDDSAFVTRHAYSMNGASNLLWVRVSANDCVCESAE